MSEEFIFELPVEDSSDGLYEPDLENIGEFIRENRKRLHMEQKELAFLIDRTSAHTSDMEYGKRAVTREIGYRISKALKLDPWTFDLLMGRLPSDLCSIDWRNPKEVELFREVAMNYAIGDGSDV